VLRDVAYNAYTKKPVKLTYRSELVSVKKLVLEILVGIQLGWVY
jgi:hypothetical protein